MKTIKVNTDIKCTGCLEKVTPSLDKNAAVNEWKVDLLDPNKPLTATVDDMSENELIEVIKQAGFNATSIG